MGGATIYILWYFLHNNKRFQSTLPVGGATKSPAVQARNYRDFNPRSLWGERRGILHNSVPFWGNFNPRSLWGERPDPPRPKGGRKGQFQSTLPVGGATKGISAAHITGNISIHAPCGGSDAVADANPDPSTYFNPRSLWGERRF